MQGKTVFRFFAFGLRLIALKPYSVLGFLPIVFVCGRTKSTETADNPQIPPVSI